MKGKERRATEHLLRDIPFLGQEYFGRIFIINVTRKNKIEVQLILLRCQYTIEGYLSLDYIQQVPRLTARHIHLKTKQMLKLQGSCHPMMGVFFLV